MNKDAKRYLEKGPSFLYRIFSFRVANKLDRLKILLIPLLTLLFPLFKAMGPFYRWRIRKRIYRWYRILRSADESLDGETTPQEVESHLVRLESLEREITGVAVPLSYTEEFYNLRLHINFVLERLRGVQSDLRESAKRA